MDFPFQEAPNTATFVCSHILSEGAPILHVAHDEEDGVWQFLCGYQHRIDEARIISLKEAFEIDHSVGQLCDMPCGHCAERKSIDDDWVIRGRGE